MKTAEEALAQFDTEGKAETVEPVQNNTPSIKMHDQDGNNIGLFVIGKLLGVREISKSDMRYMFIEVRLESTNATATIKRGKDYPTVEVKAGDIVSVYASSRLFNAVKNLPLGSRVYMKYEGIKKVQTPKGRKDAHIFTTKKLPGTLSPEDVRYIEARKDSLTKKEVEAAQKEVEAEATDALSTLED